MSDGWKWLLEIKRDSKCAHCSKALYLQKEHLVQWDGKSWHLECLLDWLTSSPGAGQKSLSPLEEFEPPNAGAPWGLLRP